MNKSQTTETAALTDAQLDDASGGAPPMFVMVRGEDGVIRCGTMPGGRGPLFGGGKKK